MGIFHENYCISLKKDYNSLKIQYFLKPGGLRDRTMQVMLEVSIEQAKSHIQPQ